MSPFPTVHTMFWNNIDPTLVQGQRRVFESLGIPLQQHNANRVQHGDWMDTVVKLEPDSAILIFCDIDAFPINKAAYEQAVELASQGCVFGLAQFSNHKPSTDLYAGPMFLAFSKRLWLELGSPSFKRSTLCDAGEALTLAARKHEKPIHLIKPTGCLVPKWALKDQGIFGIGTFYGQCEFFHLFESRQPEHEAVFALIVDDVAMGRPLQFSLYLQTMHQHPKSSRPWWKRLLGKRKS